jgi:hypothetical protein
VAQKIKGQAHESAPPLHEDSDTVRRIFTTLLCASNALNESPVNGADPVFDEVCSDRLMKTADT